MRSDCIYSFHLLDATLGGPLQFWNLSVQKRIGVFATTTSKHFPTPALREAWNQNSHKPINHSVNYSVVRASADGYQGISWARTVTSSQLNPERDNIFNFSKNNGFAQITRFQIMASVNAYDHSMLGAYNPYSR